MTANVDSMDEVPTLEGYVLEEVTLNANGEFFDNSEIFDPDTWLEAEEAPSEIISRGPVRFRIIDPDATELAMWTGVVETDSPSVLCLRVAFAQADGAPEPYMSQYVVIKVTEVVNIIFRVIITRRQLDSGPDLGPGSVRNEALDVLEAGQGLLVQVLTNADGDDQEAE